MHQSRKKPVKSAANLTTPARRAFFTPTEIAWLEGENAEIETAMHLELDDDGHDAGQLVRAFHFGDPLGLEFWSALATPAGVSVERQALVPWDGLGMPETEVVMVGMYPTLRAALSHISSREHGEHMPQPM